MENYYVNCCGKIWQNKNDYITHQNNMDIIHKTDFISPNDYYWCEVCSFSTKRITDIVRHFKTQKHLSNIGIKKEPKIYCCKNCNKTYTNYKTYYSHKQNCNIAIVNDEKENIIIENENITIEKQEPTTNEILKMLVEQQNKTNQIIEQLVQNPHNHSITNNNNNNTQNTQNNQFNIQVFLNEKCQNAMNLSDFIDSIEITNEDIENNAQQGFVKGLYKILSDNLNNLSLFDRPIHCTDPKRETVFIKEENEWSKEDHEKKLNRAIQETSRKSLEIII